MIDQTDDSSEEIDVDSLTINPPTKCVFCGIDSGTGIFLHKTKDSKWDFEGEGSCLECYIKHLCNKYAKEAINDSSNNKN